MSLELDHVFILVSEGAPEADKLTEFGFSEGEPNIHPGQGTSNRRFFFNNMMLELLWVSNSDEVKSRLTRPTMLWERWNGRNNTSPFGLIFKSLNVKAPFDGWEYKPKYLPKGFSILVGNNCKILNEPLIFKLPDSGKADLKKKQLFQNLSGFNEVSSVQVKMPGIATQSSVVKSIGNSKENLFKESANHVMEIVFDEESGGKSKDFRPGLPLIIKW